MYVKDACDMSCKKSSYFVSTVRCFYPSCDGSIDQHQQVLPRKSSKAKRHHCHCLDVFPDASRSRCCRGLRCGPGLLGPLLCDWHRTGGARPQQFSNGRRECEGSEQARRKQKWSEEAWAKEMGPGPAIFVPTKSSQQDQC